MTSSKLLLRRQGMLKSTYIKLLIIAILTCILALYILTVYRLRNTEGFFDIASDYNDLRTRLKMMSTYCELATYAQAQMKVIYMAPKPGIGDTETSDQADAHIQRTYIDVYGCKDEMASSRQTCSSGGNSDANFVSCDTYTKLPDLTDTNAADVAITLSKIPDDLADRVSREVDWYSQIVTKLTDALALGNNPPATPPDSENSPVADSSGKPWSSDSLLKQGFLDYMVPQNKAWPHQPEAGRHSTAAPPRWSHQPEAGRHSTAAEPLWSVEGFDGTCSASQAQAKIDLQKKAADSAVSCTMPTPDTEIPRVNKILDSSDLQAALAKCANLKAAMEKLKSDQQKAKDGNLYAWQKDGPKKTFATLPAGNRTDGLLSSLKQNQS